MAYVETVDYNTFLVDLHVRVVAGIYGVDPDGVSYNGEEWADLEAVYLQEVSWDEDTEESIRTGVEIEMDVSNLMVWKGKDEAPVSAWEELEDEALEEYYAYGSTTTEKVWPVRHTYDTQTIKER